MSSHSVPREFPRLAVTDQVESLVQDLTEQGAVLLPPLVSAKTLQDMQQAFRGRLQRQRWNDADGYERTEWHRLMVPDVLTLAQGFVDLGLHPLVKAVLNEYLGPGYELCEAKGWLSLPAKTDFHGWHGDSWYDQTAVTERIPREVKLAFYLTDVTSGAFQYLRGSHGRQAPHLLKRQEASQLPLDRMVEFLGPAGSAVLFDTSGIHRQAIPILKPRQAVFLNYHDPNVPLQKEDVDYYRYHPLLLNAALLGNLNAEDQRILGFGNQTNFRPHHVRATPHTWLQGSLQRIHAARLYLRALNKKLRASIRGLIRR